MNKSEIAEKAAREIRHIIICDDCKTRGISGTKKFHWPLCDYCIGEVAKIQPVIEYVCKFVERAIAESQAPQWIRVADKLPPIGERVIVSIHGIGDGIGHKTRTTGLWNGEGWLRGSLECHIADEAWPIKGEVTHWQRLPAPPLSKGNENV